MSTSKIPPHMVAWLSAEGWTAEELSFVENSHFDLEYYLERDWGREARSKIQTVMKIHTRQEAQKGERAREYDSKNYHKGKDSPSWFGEGTDRNLFK